MDAGGVRGEDPGGQVCERGACEVGVDLFDDRVSAVGLVGRDGVEQLGVGGGEEGAEPPEVEQDVLTGGSLGPRHGGPGFLRTTSRPGTCSAFF